MRLDRHIDALALRGGHRMAGMDSDLCPPARLCASFIPFSTLPAWLQPISWMLPPTYSFEGLRALIHLRVIRYDLFVEGFGINLIYMALGIAIFLRSFKKTRQGNGLLQVSE